MKKKYIAPETMCFDFEAQQMLATSYEQNVDKTTSDVWSERRGWSSEDWTEDDE